MKIAGYLLKRLTMHVEKGGAAEQAVATTCRESRPPVSCRPNPLLSSDCMCILHIPTIGSCYDKTRFYMQGLVLDDSSDVHFERRKKRLCLGDGLRAAVHLETNRKHKDRFKSQKYFNSIMGIALPAPCQTWSKRAD